MEVDWSVDAMLRSGALAGAQRSVATEFMVHMLGLDICADTIIGNAMKRGVSGGQKKRVTSGAHRHSSWRRRTLRTGFPMAALCAVNFDGTVTFMSCEDLSACMLASPPTASYKNST